MTWTLIDTETPLTKDIRGVKVTFRALTNGEKIKLAGEISKLTDSEGWCQMIAPHILNIEGQQGDIADILRRIDNFAIQLEIQKTLLTVSGLDELQQKNLSSSSDT